TRKSENSNPNANGRALALGFPFAFSLFRVFAFSVVGSSGAGYRPRESHEPLPTCPLLTDSIHLHLREKSRHEVGIDPPWIPRGGVGGAAGNPHAQAVFRR